MDADQIVIPHSIEQARKQISVALLAPGESDRLLALSKIRLAINHDALSRIDPYSDEYGQSILGLYRLIASKDCYVPENCELTNALDQLEQTTQPIPFRFGESVLVGEYLAAYGWILSALNIRAGDSVLEYGSGEGQLLINLARLGCIAHAVDIESRFLDLVRKHGNDVGVDIRTEAAQFGKGFEGQKFDRIYFFEAFHHCFEHRNALRHIHGKLRPGGFVVFAGEPVIPSNHPDRDLLPYHWGLRLDGESIRAVSDFGWMELGFSQRYFVELLIRSRFSVRLLPCPTTFRGDCYIARPFADEFPILENDLILSTEHEDCGWYPPETTHRWTNGNAHIPLPEGIESVTVRMKNLLPMPVEVTFTAGASQNTHLVKPHMETSASLTVAPGSRHLSIISSPFIPSQFDPTSSDYRALGIAVTGLAFA